MNSQNCLDVFYRNHDEENRLRSKCGMVEFITTMHFLNRFLKPEGSILEVGAGTGRYSHELARKGYHVDAVELIEHNIEEFKKKTFPGEAVTIRQGNAIDLYFLQDNTYDITLLLGPMYHLFTTEDQEQALSEAIRVTKKDGIIFAAYCMSDPAVLSMGFLNGKIQEIVKEGMVDLETFKTFSHPEDIFALYRKEDIEDLRQKFNVTPLHFIATDGHTHFMREKVEHMSDAVYNLYIKYHLATCERQDMVGYSHHTLDIFQKK